MTENRKLRSVVGPRRVDLGEGWETLQNEKLTRTCIHNTYIMYAYIHNT